MSSILGVLLAVTFVAGTFIAIDSSARATLDATLAGIPGDLSFYLNDVSVNYSLLRSEIASVAGVIDASVYRSFYINEIDNPNVGSAYPGFFSSLGIDPDHPPYVLSGAPLNGSLDLQRGEIGLSKGVASQLQVIVGDRVVAVNRVNDTIRYEVNLTVRAIVEPVETGYGVNPFVRSPLSSVPLVPIQFYSILFVHIRDVDWLNGQLNYTRYGLSLNGEVWIDRAHYVNPYDVDQTRRNLERIQRRLQILIGPQGYVSDNILSRLESFADRIASLRIQYLLLSMPVLLLGVYLGAVGVDLSHAERRRELAVLKTRGARRGQVIGLLILEAVTGGLIAAVLGLAAGVALSRFLLGVVNPDFSGSLPYEAFVLTPDTVIIVAFLSVSLMAVVAYRSAKRTSSLPIIESLRFYSPGETKIHYSPRLDVILVVVGVSDYVLVWWRGGQVTGLWTYLLGLIPFILLPFVPIMLIVGLTRLLTRSTGKVYDVFSRITRLLTKDLAYIIRKNLSRNPRRSANVAIIIALGLAFGVFSLSVLATNETHLEREIRAGVGADAAVFPTYASGWDDETANLTTVAGVAGVVRIESFSGVNPGYCCAQVYGFDPDAYFAVAQPEFWYFVDGNAQAAHGILATPGQVVISQAYYDQAFIEVGDRIVLSMQAYDRNGSYIGTVRKNVTVGGVVRFLPGIGYGLTPAIYGSLETLRPFEGLASSVFGPESSRYLVDFRPDTDWRSVKAGLLSVPAVSYVQVVDEMIEQQSSNPFSRALYGFIAMEIAFIVVILTAGVGLILYAASLERDVEFAAIIARGSSGWQTARLLVGEALVIMLVGLVIGTGVGLGTAFFATQFLAAGPPGTAGPAVPYFFVFPWDAVLLVTLGPAAILLAALVVSARTAHLNVAQVLKLRSG